MMTRMTRDRLNGLLVAVIMALDEADGAGAPEGHIYAGLMQDGVTFDDYQLLRSLLLEGGIATSSGDCLALTPRGRELAAQIELARAKP